MRCLQSGTTYMQYSRVFDDWPELAVKRADTGGNNTNQQQKASSILKVCPLTLILYQENAADVI